MSNSNIAREQYFDIKVTFNQSIEGLTAVLINGNLDTVLEKQNIGSLDLNLEKGIYQLKVYYIDYYQEYLLMADKDQNLALDFNYPIAAPILSFKTTSDNLSSNCEIASIKSTAKGASLPTFLLFCAKYDSEGFPDVKPGDFVKEYTLLNADEMIITACEPGAHIDSSCFTFSMHLEEGLYFLKWQSGDQSRIFPFYIFKGYQTQLFIRYAQNPDFENSLFFYTSKMGFKRADEEYLVLDKVLYAYKDYRNYALLTQKDKEIIAQHPYLVTLIKILQSFLNKDYDFKGYDSLELPDSTLTKKHIDKNSIDVHDKTIPLLSFVMSRLGIFRKKDGQTFEPGSLIDRTIDHAKFDVFWNSFTKIDPVSQITEIFPNSTVQQEFIVFDIDTGFTDQDAVSGGFTGMDIQFESETPLNTNFEEYNDIAKMANKLNVPPSKIARNYTQYKDIFDKLK